MADPGLIAGTKVNFVGAPGPVNVGGYFTPLVTSDPGYSTLFNVSCVTSHIKRVLLQVQLASADVQFWVYVDKSKSFGIMIGQCTILAGDSHIFIIDVPGDSISVKVKPTVAGTTIGVGGGYSASSFINAQVITLAYESLTVTNTGITTLTRDLMSNVWTALITVEDNPIRFRTDGGDPTITDGHLIQAGDTVSINTTFDALNFKCIAPGNAAKLKVSYSR